MQYIFCLMLKFEHNLYLIISFRLIFLTLFLTLKLMLKASINNNVCFKNEDNFDEGYYLSDRFSVIIQSNI
jgi:hypothetical protein